MTDHDIHALSGAYAVDAVDDVERARFERHLAVCADCRAEVASLRDSASLLGGLTDTAPPVAMRENLLAGIKGIRPLPPETGTAQGATETTEPPETYAATGRRRPRWRLVAAAAAVIALAGTGTVAVVELTRDDSSQTMTTADRILHADDATTVAAELPGGARARLVRSSSEAKAVLITSGMPDAPKGKVYELWLQVDEAMVPAGLMPDRSDQTIVLEGDASAATAAGITVEPDGGSKAPTSAPIALFNFDQSS
ncbi:anti-sigma-K factor RskA [Nocardioides albertanoniae]|uniref:Regulator of SigK n=1 Tax=Nocardioides albertanoniae TaxID=1175486 RepID=A0A543ACJ3_9ACTN|nr:anti-sigma factor [Nocardioides albertanoniae]TQL70303.1 anti-sigma-K factor RskA [Nocardioides albertanoniae]